MTDSTSKREADIKDGKEVKPTRSAGAKDKKETATVLSEEYLDTLRDIVCRTVSDIYDPDRPRSIATTIYQRGKRDEYKEDRDIVIKLAVWLENWQAQGYFMQLYPVSLSMAVDGIGYAAQNGRVTQSADIAIDLAKHIKNAERRAIHFSTTILGLGNIANAEVKREIVLLSKSADIAIELATILNDCPDLLPINCAIAILGLGRLAEVDKLSGLADIAIVLASNIISNPETFTVFDLSMTILGLAKLAMAGKVSKLADVAIDLVDLLIESRKYVPIDLANVIYGLGVLIAANKISSARISYARTLISRMLIKYNSIVSRSTVARNNGNQIVVGLGFAGLPISDSCINNLRQSQPSSLHAEVANLLDKQHHLRPKNEALINGFYCDIVIGRNIFEIDGVVHKQKRHQNFALLRDATLTKAGYVVVRINIKNFSNKPARIANYIAEFLETNRQDHKVTSSLISSSISASSTSSATTDVLPSLPLSSTIIEAQQKKEKQAKLENERKLKEEQLRKEQAERERKEKEDKAKQAQLEKEQKLKKEKQHDKRIKQKKRQRLTELVTAAIKNYSNGCCRRPSISTNSKEGATQNMADSDILTVQLLQNSPAEIIECIQNAIIKDPSVSRCNFWNNQYIIDITTLNENIQKIVSEQKEQASSSYSSS